MKLIIMIFFLLISSFSASSQNLKAILPARLQVYTLRQDGTQAVMNSASFGVFYDNLKMTGELMLNTLQTDDVILRNLLDSAITDRITFSGMIPEGQFVFKSTLDSRFSVETEIFYGDRQSKILMDFIVSNQNTSLANTFDITCSGSISLINDLGISRETGLDDKLSFQFFQNVQTRNY